MAGACLAPLSSLPLSPWLSQHALPHQLLVEQHVASQRSSHIFIFNLFFYLCSIGLRTASFYSAAVLSTHVLPTEIRGWSFAVLSISPAAQNSLSILLSDATSSFTDVVERLAIQHGHGRLTVRPHLLQARHGQLTVRLYASSS